MNDEEAEQESLLEFLYLCPVGLIQTELDGTVTMMNPKALQLLAPTAKNPAALENLFDILQKYGPEVRYMVSSYEPRSGTICDQHQIVIHPKSGGTETVLALTMIKMGVEPCRLMSVIQDVTALVQQERELRNREQRLQAIFDGIRDYAIYSLDEAGRIETWNRSAERVEGYLAEEAIGHKFGIDYPPEIRSDAHVDAVLTEAGRKGWSEEEGWRVRNSGERFWASTMVSVLRESDQPDARAQGFSVITRDMSDRKQSEDTLRRLATTDYLTGTYNRRYFFEAVPATARNHHKENKPACLIIIDADHFKRLNDTQGHQAGDEALKGLARVCERVVGNSGIVARYGGEEFVVLLTNHPLEAAAEVAERIRTSVQEGGLGITVSVGVAALNGDVDAALHAADIALYEAKAHGRNLVVVAAS